MQQLFDEFEVRNLLARLALTADDGEIDAYVALFTDDAQWGIPGSERYGQDDTGRERWSAVLAAPPGLAPRPVMS